MAEAPGSIEQYPYYDRLLSAMSQYCRTGNPTWLQYARQVADYYVNTALRSTSWQESPRRMWAEGLARFHMYSFWGYVTSEMKSLMDGPYSGWLPNLGNPGDLGGWGIEGRQQANVLSLMLWVHLFGLTDYGTQISTAVNDILSTQRTTTYPGRTAEQAGPGSFVFYDWNYYHSIYMTGLAMMALADVIEFAPNLLTSTQIANIRAAAKSTLDFEMQYWWNRGDPDTWDYVSDVTHPDYGQGYASDLAMITTILCYWVGMNEGSSTYRAYGDAGLHGWLLHSSPGWNHKQFNQGQWRWGRQMYYRSQIP